MACNIPGIPDEIHRNNRLIDQDFSADHKLFIRVERKHFENDSTKVSVSAFTTNSQSTNRDKYSNAPHVLFNINATDESQHFASWGIISLGLAELINKIFLHPEEGYQLRAYPFHTPEECMYPHSEILFKNIATTENVEIKARKLKMIIKGHYLDILTIERAPLTE